MPKKKESLEISSATRVVERDASPTVLSSPLVLCGFVGPGLAGLTTAGYVIDHLGLHETAHAMSSYIPPAVVFIGKKIRHPFRIYKDAAGKIAVLICEVPVDQSGLSDISSAVLGWLEKFSPKEIVILDGIPIRDLPENRPTFYVADEKRQADLISLGYLPAEAALISGMQGSILSDCLDRGIPCTSLLVHVSITLMDPGAPLTLIRSLNAAYDLKITTKELEEDEAMVHQELSEIVKQYQKVQQQLPSPDGSAPKDVYG